MAKRTRQNPRAGQTIRQAATPSVAEAGSHAPISAIRRDRPPAPSRIVPRRRRGISRPLLIGIGLALVFAAGLAWYFLTNQASQAAWLGVSVPDEGRNHVTEGSPIQYKTNPPSSGPHYPAPKPWGMYSDPVVPGYFVHNLEHGGIDVLYDCPSGCADIVAQLHQASLSFPKDKYSEIKLLITPYSGLPPNTPVMALAWDLQQGYPTGTFDLQKLLAFYNAHVDRGPEDIP